MRRSFARRAGVFVTLTTAIWVLNPQAAPSPMAPDALLEQQWHLKDRATEPGGANIRNAWPMSTGAGVVIGIVDDGLQWSHPDLSPNYLASASFDFNNNDSDPQPFSTAGHGTSVAGLVAGKGDNSIGVSGAAPQASLAGLRLTSVTATDSQEASAFNYLPDTIHILNNSWNPTDNGTTLKGPGSLAAAARQSAITSGRNGKGRIFVWSSGNGRLVGDDCNFDGYANSRFAIAVGASNDTGNHVSQSEGCSALMVLAPAAGTRALTTTDLIGTPGYDPSDYTSAFGTSSTGGMNAAAGTASGAVALMLSRNPNLTWRDVQYILRNTAVRIVPTDPGWTMGSLPHNERFGFGMLDAEAAVAMAGTWTNVPAEEVIAPATKTVNLTIPDINATGINDTITISAAESNFVIEHVEVDFTATHTWRGDLEVKLTSPSGVVSNLAPIRPSDNGDNFTNWKFGSVRHWGETAAGPWKLNVADRRFQDVGTWNSWTLKIYGYHTAVSAPAAFNKTSPASGATGVGTSTTLSWGASSGATSYDYCIDTSNDGACANWISTGANTSVAVSGLLAGTSYFWQARANNTTGSTYAQGAASAFWSFTTSAPPAAFSLSSPSNGATGQSLTPSLSWSSSAGATNYEYCFDTTNDGACSNWINNGANTSASIGALAGGTTYYWHARASNGAGTTYAGGSPSAFWSFATLTAPAAFSHASPSNGASGQSLTPTLAWTASSGASSYEYCFDTTNDGACSGWTGNGSSTSVNLGGLTAGTTYFWHVRALNGSGQTYADGSASAFWSFSTIAVPGAFSHSSPANGATGVSLNPTLTWSSSSGAASYEYCYDTTNDGNCSGTWTSTGSSTSASLSGLPAGTTHYWHVRAINGAGTTYAEGSASAFWAFTPIAAPAAFSHASPANGASGQPLNPAITWGSSSGATSFEYCYDTTNDNACSNWISTGTGTSANLSGLAAGTTFYWHARATNAGGTTYADGSATSFWSFTTVGAPGAFSHSSPSNGATGQSLNPTLAWTSSGGASSYEYCFDTTNDGACSGWIPNGTNTTASLSGLTPNTLYFWHVRATNTGGTTYADGSASSFWNFATLTAPAAFNRLSPSNGAMNQLLSLTLSWQSAAGATSYDYCYDTTNDGACTNWISAGANTSAAISGLAAGTPYFWQVRATNVAGTTYSSGGPTSFWSFTTMPAPVAFNMSSPANGATGQSANPTLSWSPSPNATSFEYCIDTTNDSACSGWTSTGLNTSVALTGLPAGIVHYWHVRAVNAVATVYAGGSSTAFWNFTTQVTVPGAFGHASPANGATAVANNPTLSWGASAGAASYEYCIDTTNDNACSSWTPAGTSTSVALTNLAWGTPHFWHVRAINPGGTTYAEGSASSFWTFTTQVAVPAAFNRTAPANGASGLLLNQSLSWGASAGATSYEYCFDTTNDGACANWISTGTSTSVGLSLAAGTAYFWQVRASNIAGTTYASGGASSFWSFTTMPLPVAFNMSSPANGATGQSVNPTLTWSPSPNTASFEYCIDTTNDSACSNWISTGTNTSVGLTGLPAGTTHYWHVRAVNGVGTVYAGGSPTAFWSFTTQVGAPGAFSHLSPANGATGQSKDPTLSWGAAAGATGYEYCIDTTNNNNCSGWISTGTSTSVTLSNLAFGTAHYWHVRASNAGGTTYAEGSSSAFWSFTTQVAAPGAFGKSTPANGATGISTSPTLTWSASAGVTGYEFCFDTTNDGACSSWTSTGTNPSAVLSGLSQTTTYFWHVRANNAGGTTYANGSSTSFWSFTTLTSAPGAFGHTSPSNGALNVAINPTLAWSTSTGATSYSYCVDTTNNNACDATWTSTGTNTTVVLSNLVNSTKYYWHVRATNAGGTTYADGGASAFWNFTTTSKPRSIVDLNGDGGGDALTYNSATGELTRQVTMESGGFSAGLGNWATGWVTMSAAFDADELTDLFVFNPMSGEWFKMINTGSGFVPQSNSAWWPGWQKFVMDLDGDGLSDVFLYDLESGQWFKAISTPTGFDYFSGWWSPGWEVTPMNLNGDAFGDLFLIDREGGLWFWVAGQPGGDFTYPKVGYWAPDWALHSGDFNGDGRHDFFLYRAAAGEYYVAMNNGSGYDYTPGYGWAPGWTLTVMDINADQKSDLFLYNKANGQWLELEGNGAGQFTATSEGWWTTGWDIQTTDFNDDGRMDLLLYKPGTGEWFQAWNSGPGAFTYFGGQWQAGLSVLVRPPVK